MSEAIRRREYPHTKRCPKCRSLNLYMYTDYSCILKNKYFVKCEDCECKGQKAFRKKAALKKWNRRA